MTARDFQSLMDIISRPTTRHARVEAIQALIQDLRPDSEEASEIIATCLHRFFDSNSIPTHAGALYRALERYELDPAEDPQDEKMELRIARREE